MGRRTLIGMTSLNSISCHERNVPPTMPHRMGTSVACLSGNYQAKMKKKGWKCYQCNSLYSLFCLIECFQHSIIVLSVIAYSTQFLLHESGCCVDTLACAFTSGLLLSFDISHAWTISLSLISWVLCCFICYHNVEAIQTLNMTGFSTSLAQ